MELLRTIHDETETILRDEAQLVPRPRFPNLLRQISSSTVEENRQVLTSLLAEEQRESMLISPSIPYAAIMIDDRASAISKLAAAAAGPRDRRRAGIALGVVIALAFRRRAPSHGDLKQAPEQLSIPADTLLSQAAVRRTPSCKLDRPIANVAPNRLIAREMVGGHRT